MRAVLVHSLPGRARFRVMPGALAGISASGGQDAAGFAGFITALPGVTGVNLNPRTGSILVFYDNEKRRKGGNKG